MCFTLYSKGGRLRHWWGDISIHLPSLKEINYEEIKNKGSIKYKDSEEGTKHMFVDDLREKTEA